MRALVTHNPFNVPEAQQDESCLPSQSSKLGKVPQAPTELPKETVSQISSLVLSAHNEPSQGRRVPGPSNSATSKMLTSLYRHGDSSGQPLPGQPSFSQLLQLVLLQRNSQTCQVPMPRPPLGPCIATPLSYRATPPSAQLSNPSLAKGLRRSPKSKFCLKNKKMLNPQHPPRQQSRASRGPRTCENVRNPNVWTGFLCLPQTSKHDRHSNGGASHTAVSSLPLL